MSMKVEDAYAAFAPKLASYLTGNGVSYATACDIVQETFLRLWQRKDELSDDPHEVSGLVFTIARNYRNDLMRKESRETLCESISDAEGDVEDVRVAGPSRELEDAESSAALYRRLRASLAKMPAQLLEAFVLMRVGGLSAREIAGQIKTSESNVKVRVHRAQTLLGSQLSGSAAAGQATTAFGLAFDYAAFKTVMMVAAVDGQITREELALYRRQADAIRAEDEQSFGQTWKAALESACYIGILAKTLPEEELVAEFVRESELDFARAFGTASAAERKRALGGLVEMAKADGEFAKIERSCILALVKRVSEEC